MSDRSISLELVHCLVGIQKPRLVLLDLINPYQFDLIDILHHSQQARSPVLNPRLALVDRA
jgi:hypothetical protein